MYWPAVTPQKPARTPPARRGAFSAREGEAEGGAPQGVGTATHRPAWQLAVIAMQSATHCARVGAQRAVPARASAS